MGETLNNCIAVYLAALASLGVTNLLMPDKVAEAAGLTGAVLRIGAIPTIIYYAVAGIIVYGGLSIIVYAINEAEREAAYAARDPDVQRAKAAASQTLAQAFREARDEKVLVVCPKCRAESKLGVKIGAHMKCNCGHEWTYDGTNPAPLKKQAPKQTSSEPLVEVKKAKCRFCGKLSDIDRETCSNPKCGATLYKRPTDIKVIKVPASQAPASQAPAPKAQTPGVDLSALSYGEMLHASPEAALKEAREPVNDKEMTPEEKLERLKQRRKEQ